MGVLRGFMQRMYVTPLNEKTMAKQQKRSKRYQALAEKIKDGQRYSVKDAIALVKETAQGSKFDQSIEVHYRLGIDPRKGDQQIRGTVVLPHGTGKKIRIAAFTTDESAGKASGADVFGGTELIEEIKKSGKIDFDVAIATPEIMRDLAMIAKILGPRGLMPSPKNDTVTPDLAKAVDELKKGKVSYKNDSTSNVHVSIGKASFSEEQLYENFKALHEAIKRAKPSSSKGVYLRNISMSGTMGPGIPVASFLTLE